MMWQFGTAQHRTVAVSHCIRRPDPSPVVRRTLLGKTARPDWLRGPSHKLRTDAACSLLPAVTQRSSSSVHRQNVTAGRCCYWFVVMLWCSMDCSFSILTLLVGWHEGHPSCKNFSNGFSLEDFRWLRATGVRGLTRGLATLPQRWIQEPLMVRDRDGRPPRGPPGSALLLCV